VNNNDHCNDSGSSSANGGVCGDGGSISKILKIWTRTMRKRMTKKRKRKRKKIRKNRFRRMSAIYVTLYSIPSKNYSAKK
jgi:hypothetical protein